MPVITSTTKHQRQTQTFQRNAIQQGRRDFSRWERCGSLFSLSPALLRGAFLNILNNRAIGKRLHACEHESTSGWMSGLWPCYHTPGYTMHTVIHRALPNRALSAPCSLLTMFPFYSLRAHLRHVRNLGTYTSAPGERFSESPDISPISEPLTPFRFSKELLPFCHSLYIPLTAPGRLFTRRRRHGQICYSHIVRP